MGSRSKLVAIAFLTMAYAFLAAAVPLALGLLGAAAQGYRYLLLLVAVLLVLAAHGYAHVRRRRMMRLWDADGALRDLGGDQTMTVIEILFGWLGVTFALLGLYYAAPTDGLSAWYPRLFLCLAVIFGAMYQRALVFVASAAPFVLTATALALWEGRAGESPLELLARAAFIAADVAVLWWAVSVARQYGVLASSEFELAGGRGIVGGKLSGVIRTQLSEMPEAGFTLDLSCIRQKRGSGDKAQGEILWHQRKVVRGDLPGARLNAVSVPIEFTLPTGLPGSSDGEDERVVWTLRAAAQTAESNFTAVFEMPIAKLPLSQRIKQPAFSPTLGALEPDPHPFGVEADGQTRFRFRSARNVSSEIIASSYFLFWFQLIWLSTADSIGWETWAMFAVGLWLLITVLAPWAMTVETEVADGVVKVRRRSLLGRRKRSISGLDIRAIETGAAGLRSGLVEPSEYYRVTLKTAKGAAYEAASHLRGKNQAEAVAAELREAIDCTSGVTQSAATG